MSRKRENGEGSIYPYKNGYAAYAWIETPLGRKQRKYVYGKDSGEVQEKWRKLKEAAAKGPVAPKVPRLDVYLRAWLAEVVRPNLAPETAANYDMFVRLYIAPDLGAKRLDMLTVRDVRLWVNAMRTRCQCCRQGKDAARTKPVCCAIGACCQQIASAWTRYQAWMALRSALSSAVRDELVSRNVAALVKVSVPRSKKGVVWTPEESRRFLQSAREDNDPYYVAYVLLLVLALRRGEVLGLGWEEVDEALAVVLIAWQIQRVDGKLLRRPVKTEASEAPLPLPAICLRALELQRAQQTQWASDAGKAWHRSGLVVTTRLGTAVDPRNFHRAFKARAVKAGVRVTTVHAARKACGSLLVALDVHPRVAMQILRHSKIAVTMEIYSDVTDADTEKALRRLGEKLDEGGVA